MITVLSGRHPHEVILAGMCVPVGLCGLIVPVRSAALAAFPPVFAVLWYAGTLLGGLIVLAGVCMRSPVTGPGVERIGLLLLAGLWLAYAVAVLGTSGSRGIAFALITSGFGTANVWRAWQIQRYLRAALVAIERGGDDG